MKKDYIMKVLVAGLIVLFICINIQSTGTKVEKSTRTLFYSSNTFYVGGNGTNNYTRIQDAIDDATDGDTVYVYDDSSPYYENVVLDKSINLIGENKDTTVIDGQELKNVVVFFAEGVTLIGFTIRNCGQDLSDLYAGVRVYSNNSIINNNNIRENGDYGIYLERSSRNNVISENYIGYNDNAGITIRPNSNSNFIFNNIIEYKEASWPQAGIVLDYSFNNLIENNSILGNYYGIILYDSFSNKILNNSIISNHCGLEIVRGKENTIFCNNFIGGQCIILSVTVNNIIINNTINEAFGDVAGVHLYHSDHNKVAGNKITNNYVGACIGGNSNIVKDNIIELNHCNGMYLVGNYNVVEGNIIDSNGENGISLSGTGDYNVIVGNSICYNNENGIYNDESCRNIFCYNNISFNHRVGLDLVCNSNNNIVNGNKFFKNRQSISISDYSSFNNSIFHNNFFDNLIHPYDEFNNSWDDGYPSGGNYWDHYTGIDADGDGIGDTPYDIPGGDNKDRYPLMLPYINQGAPDRPLIGEETSDKIGKKYNYTFVTTDPDGDEVYYYIDWGDNTSSGWLGPYTSGVAVIQAHKWSHQGTYIIKAKAKDSNSEESDWGTHSVTIPKNKQSIQNTKFLQILEQLMNCLRGKEI